MDDFIRKLQSSPAFRRAVAYVQGATSKETLERASKAARESARQVVHDNVDVEKVKHEAERIRRAVAESESAKNLETKVGQFVDVERLKSSLNTESFGRMDFATMRDKVKDEAKKRDVDLDVIQEKVTSGLNNFFFNARLAGKMAMNIASGQSKGGDPLDEFIAMCMVPIIPAIVYLIVSERDATRKERLHLRSFAREKLEIDHRARSGLRAVATDRDLGRLAKRVDEMEFKAKAQLVVAEAMNMYSGLASPVRVDSPPVPLASPAAQPHEQRGGRWAWWRDAAPALQQPLPSSPPSQQQHQHQQQPTPPTNPHQLQQQRYARKVEESFNVNRILAIARHIHSHTQADDAARAYILLSQRWPKSLEEEHPFFYLPRYIKVPKFIPLPEWMRALLEERMSVEEFEAKQPYPFRSARFRGVTDQHID